MAVDKQVQIEDDSRDNKNEEEQLKPGGDTNMEDRGGDDVGRDNEDAQDAGQGQDGIKEDGVSQNDSREDGDSQSKQEQGKEEISKPTTSKDESGAVGDPDDGKVGQTVKEIEQQNEDVIDKNKSTTRPVSSIDINIPQVEKDAIYRDEEQNKDDDDDDDDDDDTQSVAMGTTKSVTFSIHHNVDAVDAEIAQVTMVNKASDDQMSSFDVEVECGGRAETTNTPVTVITEYQDEKKSTGNQTPCENIYEHAISVMRNRSSMTHYTQSQTTIKSNMSSGPSSAMTVRGKTADGLPIYPLPTVVARIKEAPFADCTNCSFYVLQKRIHPVPPVKAWKGYHSNVYFEPMVCRKAVMSPNSTPRTYPQNMIQQSTQKTPSKLSSPSQIELPEINPTNQNTVSQGESNKSVRIAKSAATIRSGAKSRATAKSRASTSVPRSRPLTTASRQLAVLDKLSVLDNMDSHIREDIKWIDGLESTGTLQVGEPMRRTGSTTHIYTRKAGSGHYKMRIRRGLVSHKPAGQYNASPTLGGVSGGRIVDSPSKLDFLEQTYHGESHFLTNPHGMFASPEPLGSLHSSSPLPSLHRKQPNASLPNNDVTDSTVINLSNSTKQPMELGK